jgi:hypothetical protein
MCKSSEGISKLNLDGMFLIDSLCGKFLSSSPGGFGVPAKRAPAAIGRDLLDDYVTSDGQHVTMAWKSG